VVSGGVVRLTRGRLEFAVLCDALPPAGLGGRAGLGARSRGWRRLLMRALDDVGAGCSVRLRPAKPGLVRSTLGLDWIKLGTGSEPSLIVRCVTCKV
jgi:hypothetical protein